MNAPPVPLADAGTVAGVRDALAWWPENPKYALAGEKKIAAWLLSGYVGLDEVIRTGLEFHRRAAEWAVLGSDEAPPAAWVLFGSAGFPAPGEFLHERAAAASPRARVAYCVEDQRLFDVNSHVLAGSGRVSVVQAAALDPAEVLGALPFAATRRQRGAKPGSVHLVLTPARWPADTAAAVAAGYAELLPPGSTVCLSLVIPDPGPAGARMTEDAALAGGPAFGHTRKDVEGWIEGAGMRLHPQGVTSARAWGRPWAEAYRVAPQVPGRPVEAVGIVL